MRRDVGGLSVGLGAGLLVSTLAYADSLPVWRTADTFMAGVRRQDCAQVERVSVWTAEPGSVCSGEVLGFGRAVDGYHLARRRVDGRAEETAVAVRLPGQQRAYSLHLVRRGAEWVVDGVDVAA